jgi:D-serine deaminase-like pyridoxal phosphate-dependent protein
MNRRPVPDFRGLARATSSLEPPFAVVDLAAFDANAAELLRLAAGKPVRLASKSVRCRFLADRASAAGFSGVLAFTLPEALWLDAQGTDDVVVAYPSTDSTALAAAAGRRVTLMVDCEDHLDAAPAGGRVCLDLDAGWRPLDGRIRIGARRSPVRTPGAAAALARAALARGLVVDGVMAYEAQIAGVGDAPPGRPLYGAAVRAMQAASARELASRRGAMVAAVRAVAPLRFVNGGGTGSVARTAADRAVTEIAAGSGLFGPTLFDAYRAWRPRPAAFFVLPVVRKPSAATATVLGGGYVASGAPGRDRLPVPVHPPGLRLDRTEGAGEVQTPLLGAGAAGLAVGDRVWFRHAKAGELCERFATLALVAGDALVEVVPTYRGEGHAFL